MINDEDNFPLERLPNTEIRGKDMAMRIKTDIRQKFESLHNMSMLSRHPKLVVVQVGDRVDSSTYIRMKKKACSEIGFDFLEVKLPVETTRSDLVTEIEKLNQDKGVDGILLQLPLSDTLKPHTQEILDVISPQKDVDGLTTYNQGRLLEYYPNHPDSENFLIPCTPKGCMTLIKSTNVSLVGEKAVVIGRSQLVGKPMALLLMAEGMTVTICHSKTPEDDLKKFLSEAKVVVISIGKAEAIDAEWINDQAIVIDVGINSVDDPTSKKGYRLTGDLDTKKIKEKKTQVGYYTPVPGGVGPMTVASLMENTFKVFMKENFEF